jgi:hypothetical protein
MWNRNMSSQFVAPLVLIILSIQMVTGCKKEDPSPELRDPLYSEFVSQRNRYQKLLEDTEKGLQADLKALESTEPRTLDVKIQRNAILKKESQITEARQMLEYYRVRAELRRVYARKSYKIAFRKGEEWPDPSEINAYQTNKKLVDAPRSWGHRVPKNSHQELSAQDMKKGAE